MSWIVRYEQSPIEGVNLPIESVTYSKHEREGLERQISESPNAFTVKDSEGNIVVTGTFAGDKRDKDWPLEAVRRHAEGMVEAVRIEYQDGSIYLFNPEYGAVVLEKDG